ncbi:MAG: hypothetical protein Ct9H300mP14_15890 [Gammaproteobacteria bacterium]|nr:MAG: hypothetical protein Ct9H300mP14_15890 [Gammaproteobacteria bacterium]
MDQSDNFRSSAAINFFCAVFIVLVTLVLVSQLGSQTRWLKRADLVMQPGFFSPGPWSVWGWVSCARLVCCVLPSDALWHRIGFTPYHHRRLSSLLRVCGLVSDLCIHYPMGWLSSGDAAIYAGAQSPGGISWCTMDDDSWTYRVSDRVAVQDRASGPFAGWLCL